MSILFLPMPAWPVVAGGMTAGVSASIKAGIGLALSTALVLLWASTGLRVHLSKEQASGAASHARRTLAESEASLANKNQTIAAYRRLQQIYARDPVQSFCSSAETSTRADVRSLVYDTKQYPYNAVGILRVRPDCSDSGVSLCSGALIRHSDWSKSYVLTAAHCLEAPGSTPPPVMADFTPGYNPCELRASPYGRYGCWLRLRVDLQKY